MFGLHLIQAVLMLWLGLTLIKISNFKLPFTVSFLTYDQNLKALVTNTKNVSNLPIGAMVSIFLFISALAHFLIILPRINNFYNSRLSIGINYFRWFEYALSSSVMIVIIAMLFGVYDLGSIILIIGLNATMNLCGLLMEIHNHLPKKQIGLLLLSVVLQVFFHG